MSDFDPNYMSVEFSAASAGYLTASAAELVQIKARLPRPVTIRERAIYAAIEHRINQPSVRLDRRNVTRTGEAER